MTKEEMWDYLIERDIATENELRLISDINGFSRETMEDVLEVRTGDTSFD